MLNKDCDFFNDIHEIRLNTLKKALIEEILLHYKTNFGDKNIEQLYDSASLEFFRLDEKQNIIKEAIEDFQDKFNIKIVNTKPLVFEEM